MGAIWTPSNGLLGCESVDLTTRPGASVTVTPGASNVMGSYVQAVSALAADCYGLEVWFGLNGVSATVRDTLCTIGVDPAGGSSYSDLIPNLSASAAAALSSGLGIRYYFPIFIKAGSTIGVKAQVNNATAGTLKARVLADTQPTDTRLARAGSFVEAIGATAASSNGTAVTAGGAAEGAWTLLGTTTKRTWWHQLGFCCSSTTFTGAQYAAELAVGDGTNFDILVRDMLVQTTTAEQVSFFNPERPKNVREIPASSSLYGRLQASALGADTGTSLIAYALGG